MPILYSFKIEGMDDLVKALRLVANQNEQSKALRAAVTAGMTPVLKEAKAAAPEGRPGELHKTHRGRLVASPFLSRNIKKTSWRGKRAPYAVARVGPRIEAFYGTQFVEFGTKNPPENRKWLERAYERRKSEALANARRILAKRITELAKK